MEKYLAHIADDGREQTVLEHLKGTAELCRTFAAVFGAEEQGELAGLAHDIGKYSKEFQRRITDNGPKVDHSTAGAIECRKLNQLPAAMAAAGHHGGIPDRGTQADGQEGSSLLSKLKRQGSALVPDYSFWQREVKLPRAALPAYLSSRQTSAEDGDFFIRMLYSCLVDADYLDTEAFMLGRKRERPSYDMAELYEKLSGYIQDWYPPKTDLNIRRCRILESCIEAGEQERGAYTLTVPTGGGKTVASLAWALNHARLNGMDRVIYVIPYTSIIEQTSKEFRKILGEENVLEHHSGVSYDQEPDEELNRENYRLGLATENWDMPVIVTTAVQFFQSIYSNRSSRCRKVHNMANSVIIFDEAQMLPLPYLKPCVSAISQLVKNYRSSVLLCTATQPSLDKEFKAFLPNTYIKEICPHDLTVDPIFRRVHFERIPGKLDWQQLAGRMMEHKQALCIVNSRRGALELFHQLSGEGCYHLSTFMAPAHRRQVLEEIKTRLDDGKRCLIVSTSLIEAGVDIDVPVVFREEAGLDSIIQAAGRCNRNGKESPEKSPVYIFRAEDAPPKMFAPNIGIARLVLDKYDDPLDLDAIKAYFTGLRDVLGEKAKDRDDIMDFLRRAEFRRLAEKFHLIENDTTTVYVPWGKGEDLIQQLREGKYSRALFRELGQYSVAVYSWHVDNLRKAGALDLMPDGSAVLIRPDLYSEKTGLNVRAEGGQAFVL